MFDKTIALFCIPYKVFVYTNIFFQYNSIR